MNKPRIAFICAHNSCRSQIAEALARQMASEVLDSCSAGTNISGGINPDAIRLMKETFGIDLIHAGQYPKMLSELPAIDIAVTMGCGVQCPNLPCRMRRFSDRLLKFRKSCSIFCRNLRFCRSIVTKSVDTSTDKARGILEKFDLVAAHVSCKAFDAVTAAFNLIAEAHGFSRQIKKEAFRLPMLIPQIPRQYPERFPSCQ